MFHTSQDKLIVRKGYHQADVFDTEPPLKVTNKLLPSLKELKVLLIPDLGSVGISFIIRQAQRTNQYGPLNQPMNHKGVLFELAKAIAGL